VNTKIFVIKFVSTKHCFRKKLCANHFTNKNIFTFTRKYLIKTFSEQIFLIRKYYETRMFVFFGGPWYVVPELNVRVKVGLQTSLLLLEKF